MIFEILIFVLQFVFCEHFECATTDVNVRASPCGTKVRICAWKEHVTVVAVSSITCWGYSWLQFDDGTYAASAYFEECNKKVCTTENDVDIRNGPGDAFPVMSKLNLGESLDWTGETYEGELVWYKFSNGHWGISTSFGECDDDDDDDDDDDYIEHVTTSQLKACMKDQLSSIGADFYIEELNRVLSTGSITTCERISCFLAQVGHESLSLKYWEELADGTDYNGRTDLCNGPDDGPKYKGRGPIQLTGKCNYQDASEYIYGNQDVLDVDPYRVRNRDVGFETTVWYWMTRNLNTHCDENTQDGFDAVTLLINGGYNGKEDRDERWNICKGVLNCSS